MRRLRILTWHVHGNYLWYLSHIPHDIFLPVRPGGEEGYGGRGASFPWGDNVHEVPADDVKDLDVDVVLTQSHRNWLEDRPAILSQAQLRLPHVHIEHDPPRASPTDTRHPIDDPDVLLVHVTSFNRLMWDSGRTPTRVIEHGVLVPEGIRYTGELARGLVVVNGLAHRGRRLGADVFERVRNEVPSTWSACGRTSSTGWARSRRRGWRRSRPATASSSTPSAGPAWAWPCARP